MFGVVEEMNKKELKKAFEEKLITEQQYKDELFKLATQPNQERKSKKLPLAMTEEEFTQLYKATLKKHHKVSFLLGYGAGMRVSEIKKLQPTDINLREKTIMIRSGKGDRDRVVPLPKGFKESMISYIPLKISIRALQQAFYLACKRAGLNDTKPGLHFHSLRHSFGTRLVSQGVPIHHIRTLMGHSNISTTNVYLEANPKDALKSYEDNF